jgi:Ca2+-binding EF-hand superfamily protein
MLPWRVLTRQFFSQEKGGILITDEELRAAFDFFDVNSSGKITLANLKVSGFVR